MELTKKGLVSEMVKKMADDLNAKKESLIMQRLAELGLEGAAEEDKHRRFKKLLWHSEGERETLYYDDGSAEGLRVLTFVSKTSPIGATMTCEIEYY